VRGTGEAESEEGTTGGDEGAAVGNEGD